VQKNLFLHLFPLLVTDASSVTIFLNVTDKVSVHGESVQDESVTNSEFLPYHLTPLPFHLPANQENPCPLN